jgi:hypothetical protein
LNYELIDIVKAYIRKNKSAKATAIKNVYESLYHLDDKSAEDYVRSYVKMVDQQIASNNIYEVLGSQNRNEIISWGSPLVWTVLKDEKKRYIYDIENELRIAKCGICGGEGNLRSKNNNVVALCDSCNIK